MLLKKCCCIVNLRIGCLILGYLQMVARCVRNVYYILVFFNTVMTYMHQTEDTDAHKNFTYIQLWLCAFMVAVGVVDLVLAFVMVIGLHKYRSNLIKPYFLVSPIIFAVSTILLILNCTHLGLIAHVLQGFDYVFTLYTILVVWSYFGKLRRPVIEDNVNHFLMIDESKGNVGVIFTQVI